MYYGLVYTLSPQNVNRHNTKICCTLYKSGQNASPCVDTENIKGQADTNGVGLVLGFGWWRYKCEASTKVLYFLSYISPQEMSIERIKNDHPRWGWSERQLGDTKKKEKPTRVVSTWSLGRFREIKDQY